MRVKKDYDSLLEDWSEQGQDYKAIPFNQLFRLDYNTKDPKTLSYTEYTGVELTTAFLFLQMVVIYK